MSMQENILLIVQTEGVPHGGEPVITNGLTDMKLIALPREHSVFHQQSQATQLLAAVKFMEGISAELWQFVKTAPIVMLGFPTDLIW